MKSLPSVQKVVVVPYVSANPDASIVPRAVTLEEFIGHVSAKKATFKRMPFNHPLYILYSSGTTGVPKCIIHGAGGTSLIICATFDDIDIVQNELIGALQRILVRLGAPPQLLFTTRAGWEARRDEAGNARSRTAATKNISAL